MRISDWSSDVCSSDLKRYGQFIENFTEPYATWRFTTLTKAFAQILGVSEKGIKKSLGDEYEDLLSDFVMKHAQQVVRLARPDYNAVSSEARGMIEQSNAAPNEVPLLDSSAQSKK